jgi:hypothetical protein
MQNVNKQLENRSIIHMVEGFLRCGFNRAVKWLKNILTGIESTFEYVCTLLITSICL